MATLRVVRDSGYADRLRAYKVVVDGTHIGEIRNGEVKNFVVAGGRHELSLKIDWCGSKPLQFTINDGDLLTFDAKSNLRGARLVVGLWCALFAWSSWIILTRRG